ncbi:OTU domain-containing protein 6B [Boothiomyces sp. JEL0866]|nr:OTU domain-containing protein 6B [Boothiomyces sp. JEL0866]
MEEILSRHKKELKLLQGEIMQLKKSVGKGSASKSRKKEVEQQIVQMELDLKTKHENEIKLAQANTPTVSDDIALEVAVDKIQEKVTELEIEPTVKKSKAKRRKEKRENEFEAMRAEAAKEAESMPDNRALEFASIEGYLQPLNLKIRQVSEADGHCLFNAIADQILLYDTESTLNFQDLRKVATAYMKSHSGDFVPFLTNKNGDMLSEGKLKFIADEFESYCNEMCTGALWGGQNEIQALCKALELQIHIIQMNSIVVKLGEEHNRLPPLLISYHRFSYGLGEHYNSVVPA